MDEGEEDWEHLPQPAYGMIPPPPSQVRLLLLRLLGCLPLLLAETNQAWCLHARGPAAAACSPRMWSTGFKPCMPTMAGAATAQAMGQQRWHPMEPAPWRGCGR